MLKSILVGTSLLAASLMLGSCGEKAEKAQEPAAFVTIQGQDLIKPDGTKLFIMGTNLGNWLNPEGYMFKFSKTNSPRFINEMFCQLVGPTLPLSSGKRLRTIISPVKMFSSSRIRVRIQSVCRFTISCSQMRTLWG